MANPPTNITWVFRTTNGVKNVLASSRKGISHSFDANGSNGPVSESILVVRDVIQTDSGMYNCETTNTIFTETVSVNFSVSVTGELACYYFPCLPVRHYAMRFLKLFSSFCSS